MIRTTAKGEVMPLKMALIVMAFMVLVLPAVPGLAEEEPVLKTERERVNYAIGVNMIGNFKQQGIDIDLEMVMQGMKDALSGGKLLLTDEELRKSIMVYQAEMRLKQAKIRIATSETNRKEGEAFLAENRKKEGVVALPSGLQYRILKTGNGTKPADADTVECRYRGTLVNGVEFDSSNRAGNPSVFKISDIIPGWREALKLMPVGSTWQLFIPPQLAYGERGAGISIGPNATLIYEVELIAIK